MSNHRIAKAFDPVSYTHLDVNKRQAVKKDGRVYVQSGGGVVADSDPEKEYQESINKAMAVVEAVKQSVEVMD